MIKKCSISEDQKIIHLYIYFNNFDLSGKKTATPRVDTASHGVEKPHPPSADHTAITDWLRFMEPQRDPGTTGGGTPGSEFGICITKSNSPGTKTDIPRVVILPSNVWKIPNPIVPVDVWFAGFHETSALELPTGTRSRSRRTLGRQKPIPSSENLPSIYNSNNPERKTEFPRVDNAREMEYIPTPMDMDCDC